MTCNTSCKVCRWFSYQNTKIFTLSSLELWLSYLSNISKGMCNFTFSIDWIMTRHHIVNRHVCVTTYVACMYACLCTSENSSSAIWTQRNLGRNFHLSNMSEMQHILSIVCSWKNWLNLLYIALLYIRGQSVLQISLLFKPSHTNDGRAAMLRCWPAHRGSWRHAVEGMNRITLWLMDAPPTWCVGAELYLGEV